MHRIARPSHRPTLASLALQWLVLLALVGGILVSSIGATRSHGVAALAAAHGSAQPSAAHAHGHAHADPVDEFSWVDERASGEHPHHGMDHSHDTAHHHPLAWSAVSSQPARWQAVVRPWIDTGQAYRLDRPPMG